MVLLLRMCTTLVEWIVGAELLVLELNNGHSSSSMIASVITSAADSPIGTVGLRQSIHYQFRP